MIASAIQRDNSVFIYDERGAVITYIQGELQGYTSSTVSIKRGTTIFVYDDHGAMQRYFNA